MKRKIKRDSVLYLHIQRKNHEWIKKQMKAFGYSKTRGKSEFVDLLITDARMNDKDACDYSDMFIN